MATRRDFIGKVSAVAGAQPRRGSRTAGGVARGGSGMSRPVTLAVAVLSWLAGAGRADASPVPATYQDPVVVIDNPTRPSVALRLADEPSFAVGLLEGPDEYLFHRIEGGARMSDGSVVVAVRSEYEVRRFGPQGDHLWTRGREGEGPGEFQSVWLLPSCTRGDSVVTYDIYLRRVTVFDGRGDIVHTHPLMLADGQRPYRLVCAPNGRFVLSTWGDRRADAPGPHRWEVSLAFSDGDDSRIEVIRENIPGQERVQYGTRERPTSNGPRTWGRQTVSGATDDGAWLGTGDDYELEFLDWSGVTRKKIRWIGPDFEVTSDHLQAEYDRRLASAGGRSDPAFERRWTQAKENLPSRFPAYSRLLVLEDGSFWVEQYPRANQIREWLVFNPEGTWIGTLALPDWAVILDAGADWVLLHVTDALGVEKLAVYGLVLRP